MRLVAVLVAAFLAVIPLSLLAANPFNDLVPNSVHNANIDAIYNAGITTGCVPNQSYCPTDKVTRQEMASFLARTAGLGSNPPVANAKTAITAQTAANADNATHASSADTATNAANAQLLQGLPANALVRVNANANPNTVILTGSYQQIASTTITVPGPGFVYVTAATVVAVGSSSYSARVAAHVRDTTTNLSSYDLYQDFGVVGGTTQAGSLSPTTVFQVAGPASHTFVIEAATVSGLGIPIAGNATVSALYVPFGPGGAQGAENDTPNEPAQPPKGWPSR